ncbi:MAG: germination protein YpeB [Clostridia bacterium]
MIEKFEIKVNKWKRKINKKALGVAMFMIFGAISIFAMDMTNNYKRQKQLAQDGYNKAMYEIVGYIKNIEIELNKLQLTNTTKLTSTTLANIWRQSNLAKSNLESLPVKQEAMQNASKYLSQLSDYSYVLLKQVVSGKSISQEEYKQVANMYIESKELALVMEDIYDDLNIGRLHWDELQKQGDKELPNVEVAQAISNVEKIDKTFQEYEGLIYDGAFSDHLLTQLPKALGQNEFSQEEAKEYLNEVFGKNNIEYIKELGESSGKVDLYNFEMKRKSSECISNISVTKKGCKIYLMLGDRRVTKSEIDIDKAKELGKEFLKKLGMDNMKDTYYLTVENMAIINFAPYQEDTILYPDLVKVKIALDTGEICSIESQGYLFNHEIRKDLNPKISEEKAKAVINKNIEISSSNLCIIPTESKTEVLAYEFKGKNSEREFLIFVNAITGVEEKILLILNTPGGILTM